MKIGIMGGTFDPVHIGHLIAAESALAEASLDEVWFVPSYTPPHKEKTSGTTAEQRLDMVRLAIQDNPKFRLSDIEIERGGTSYTIDTIRAFIERFPNDSFYFIIGADMVKILPKWQDIDQLARLVTFLGLKRPGYAFNLDAMPEYIRNSVRVISMPRIDLSSTWIRARRAQGRSIRYTVPESVNRYVEEKRLYEIMDA